MLVVSRRQNGCVQPELPSAENLGFTTGHRVAVLTGCQHNGLCSDKNTCQPVYHTHTHIGGFEQVFLCEQTTVAALTLAGKLSL